ncbi:zinc finger MYM-type protein 1-like [Sipha flava]|uniref:Zinc finger MYM-type protein 1-like n=1 Tax=Sipha flava TaxID=143950 RepID=A0A8B8FAT0_9HEMI|nr:zinc finger MYM-type protein 1-like [Sipha flava]
MDVVLLGLRVKNQDLKYFFSSIEEENYSVSTNHDGQNVEVYDLSDLSTWPKVLTHIMKYEIVKLGPMQIKNFDFPPNEEYPKRSFSVNYYYRKLPNNEVFDRQWLVYSKTKNCVNCFAGKLFSKEIIDDNNYDCRLANSGFNDWKHLSETLKSHERSIIHYKSIQCWNELKLRISSDTTINKTNLALMEKEKMHWRDVLKRIVSVIHYLAKNNNAFRGQSDVLFTKNNGNFLGSIEMLSNFDPVIIEHVKRITNSETHVHYLGHEIQNEFIIIMDCTPDISHNEQLLLMIRVVNMYDDDQSKSPDIEEYFLDFIPVFTTTGLNLSNILLENLNKMGINIMDCRGQAYDNGSNMVGKYQGVQTRIINQNPRAFFTPCVSHNLNLVLRDSVKNSVQASTFFGTIQRVYTIFSASTSRWDIFKKHCELLTVKKWSETRWESRVNSVKALRYQLPNIIEALEEVSREASDTMSKSEAQSLANEISTFEFVLSLVIWYSILIEVNVVSKILQGRNIDIDISNKMLESLLIFLRSFKQTGFENSIVTAKEICEENDIEANFKSFLFFYIVDQAISSMETRFKQLESYKDDFGFLFRIRKLTKMADSDLLKHCMDLQNRLTDRDSKDIDALDLYAELLIFRSLVYENQTLLEALSIVKNSNGSFPNISVALRILLTIPVTSASAERSFSKLKIIKNYLRNRISQEQLTGLSIISIEKVFKRFISLLWFCPYPYSTISTMVGS